MVNTYKHLVGKRVWLKMEDWTDYFSLPFAIDGEYGEYELVAPLAPGDRHLWFVGKPGRHGSKSFCQKPSLLRLTINSAADMDALYE